MYIKFELQISPQDFFFPTKKMVKRRMAHFSHFQNPFLPIMGENMHFFPFYNVSPPPKKNIHFPASSVAVEILLQEIINEELKKLAKIMPKRRRIPQRRVFFQLICSSPIQVTILHSYCLFPTIMQCSSILLKNFDIYLEQSFL